LHQDGVVGVELIIIIPQGSQVAGEGGVAGRPDAVIPVGLAAPVVGVAAGWVMDSAILFLPVRNAVRV